MTLFLDTKQPLDPFLAIISHGHSHREIYHLCGVVCPRSTSFFRDSNASVIWCRLGPENLDFLEFVIGLNTTFSAISTLAFDFSPIHSNSVRLSSFILRHLACHDHSNPSSTSARTPLWTRSYMRSGNLPQIPGHNAFSRSWPRFAQKLRSKRPT